jgi:predicted HNH restriction endonuclease
MVERFNSKFDELIKQQNMMRKQQNNMAKNIKTVNERLDFISSNIELIIDEFDSAGYAFNATKDDDDVSKNPSSSGSSSESFDTKDSIEVITENLDHIEVTLKSILHKLDERDNNKKCNKRVSYIVKK